MLMPIPTPYIAAAAAGLTYVGSSKAENASTITLPTMSEGDVCFLFIASDNTSSTGYYALGNDWRLQFAFSAGIPRSIYHKRMGASPDTSVTLPSTASAATAIAVRGASFPLIDMQLSFSGSGQADPAACSGAESGDMSIVWGAMDDENLAGAGSVSSGYTTVQSATENNAGLIHSQLLGYQSLSSGGSIDPGAFSGAGGSNPWVATHFVVPARQRTIEFIGASTVGDSTTLTLPSGLQEDDIVIVFQGRDDALPSTPSGYTSILGTDINSARLRTDYKFMGATPDTTVTVDSSSAAVAVAFRGVDTTTPMDTTAQESSGSTTMPDPPSITTVTDEAFVLVAGFLDDDLNKATNRAPIGYAMLADEEYGSSGNGGTTMVAGQYKATAGAENPGNFNSPNVDNVVAQTIALRPQT